MSQNKYQAETIVSLIEQFVKEKGMLPLTSVRSQPIRNRFGFMTVGQIDDALENDMIENIDIVLMGVDTPVLTTRDLILATGIAVVDESSAKPRLKPADYLLSDSGRDMDDLSGSVMSAEKAYEQAWKAATENTVAAPKAAPVEATAEEPNRSKIRKAYLQSSTGMSGPYGALRRAQWAIQSHKAPEPKAE